MADDSKKTSGVVLGVVGLAVAGVLALASIPKGAKPPSAIDAGVVGMTDVKKPKPAPRCPANMLLCPDGRCAPNCE